MEARKTELDRYECRHGLGYTKISGEVDQVEIVDSTICHKTEPYVYSQMIAGKDAYKPGEAKNSWLTGTASWNFYAISQFILGIRTDFDGLVINPVIPKAWDGYVVTRKFRGATYRIEVSNPAHVSTGIAELSLNGEKLEGNLVPICQEGSVNKVGVVLGK